jgi:hypothetical protein
MSQYKTCTKCGQSQPQNTDFFCKDARQTSGFRPDCKTCSRARARIYNKRNAQANRNRVKAWRIANPERAKKSKQQNYQKNKKRIQAEWRAKYKANPEKFITSKYRRRAREKNVKHEPYTWKDVVAKWGSDCHLCGKPIDLNAPRWTAKKGWEEGLHLDHVIRISKGGPDTLENVKPSHGKCNMRKH